VFRKKPKQIARLRELDQTFRDWKPPAGFTHRVSRDESFGVVRIDLDHAEGGGDIEVYYNDSMAKAQARVRRAVESIQAMHDEAGS
jgi:hypothetical protein